MESNDYFTSLLSNINKTKIDLHIKFKIIIIISIRAINLI